MSVKQITTSILLSSSMLLVPSLAAPVLEQRQTNTFSIIDSLVIGLIKGSEPGPNICQTEGCFTEDGQEYWYANLQAPNGGYVAVCYQNNSQPILFGQAEADAANCLTNLHYTQADTCIDVAGSSCDNGYTAGGGHLQSLKELILGSGTQSGARLSASDSATLQYGISSLVGATVRGGGGNGPFFFVTDSTGSKSESYPGQMMVTWKGEDDC